MTALFFAVESVQSASPVVFTYDANQNQIISHDAKRSESPFDPDITKIMQPTWHSLRVAMQAGWHTVHKIYCKEGENPTVRPLNDMPRHETRTGAIYIDPHAIDSIRKELADMGIRHTTIYGDLQSVCTSIQNSITLVKGAAG